MCVMTLLMYEYYKETAAKSFSLYALVMGTDTLAGKARRGKRKELAMIKIGNAICIPLEKSSWHMSLGLRKHQISSDCLGVCIFLEDGKWWTKDLVSNAEM